MDPGKLDIIGMRPQFLYGGDSWAIVIIRRGCLVKELYTLNILYHTLFDIFSATCSSQQLNPHYGLGLWVNRAKRFPDLPDDLFWLQSYRSDCCYMVPSLDLVVARVGSGPVGCSEADLIQSIAAAILEAAP